MKFTQAGWEAVNGTSLQGYVPATYEQLVERFGQPEGGGDKTTVEWMLQFEDGTVATIYDWKEYETPMGMYHWHIGGKNNLAVARVTAAFKQGATV
jgi:hypothetical protein